jgi:hypothetical protein
VADQQAPEGAKEQLRIDYVGPNIGKIGQSAWAYNYAWLLLATGSCAGREALAPRPAFHLGPPVRDMGLGPRPVGPKWKWPRIGGAIKRGAALCQHLVSCDHYGGVKLLGEIISAFSPQNSSSTEKGVWTRRESNLRRLRGVQAACRNPERSEGPLHFDREPCYRCTTGPERSLRDDAEDSKNLISNFIARVPNWDRPRLRTFGNPTRPLKLQPQETSSLGSTSGLVKMYS